MRPQAIEALAGVEMILHAGDIGNQQVLDTGDKVQANIVELSVTAT